MYTAVFLDVVRNMLYTVVDGRSCNGRCYGNSAHVAEQKQRAAAVLSRDNLNASQAINLMYDRIILDGQTDFLQPENSVVSSSDKWAAAAQFVDRLSTKHPSRFDAMTKSEIKLERLRTQGLM